MADIKKMLLSSSEHSSPSPYGTVASPPAFKQELKESPMYVITQNQKGAFFKEQLWKHVQFLVALFLILSVIEGTTPNEVELQFRKNIHPDNVDRKTADLLMFKGLKRQNKS
ncbi:hypothetical protein OS493_038496 [Desmophyllum pertusum]|uniref:Uncharacterized protein n=1 Tax=Desmophyllum pertusum TaxID=174260 RepID=A0A9W9ZW99_9CNID|nr:hypothetical protein OS493_038496 [Desmophyllum pertusum]